jgi:hypothetical protein
VTGGVSGEAAVAAVLVTSLPHVLTGRPGLLNAAALPLVHALNLQELASLPPRKR